MVDLPDDDGLVGVFNNITSTMLMMDSDVELSVSSEAMGSRLYCTAVLGMPGPSPITVAVSSDEEGASSLACALFALEHHELEESMLSDTMAELSNMFAGQLKGSLNLQQSLGLPKVLQLQQFLPALSEDTWHHIAVKTGDAQVLLSVSTDAEVVGHYIS